jgi:hypothetical protein
LIERVFVSGLPVGESHELCFGCFTFSVGWRRGSGLAVVSLFFVNHFDFFAAASTVATAAATGVTSAATTGVAAAAATGITAAATATVAAGITTTIATAVAATVVTTMLAVLVTAAVVAAGAFAAAFANWLCFTARGFFATRLLVAVVAMVMRPATVTAVAPTGFGR